jgi:glycerophosphoryl diester phosphodiesterase
MLTPAGLREISTYAQGIGPSLERMLPTGPFGRIRANQWLVTEAHRAELAVFVWTLRAENAFLPPTLRRGVQPSGTGNVRAAARTLLDLGIDGLIADSPDHAVRARAELAVPA